VVIRYKSMSMFKLFRRDLFELELVGRGRRQAYKSVAQLQVADCDSQQQIASVQDRRPSPSRRLARWLESVEA
jgi:hypothetical protein